VRFGGGGAAPGTVVTDVDGRIIAADAEFCDILGRAVEDVVGMSPPYPWWPDDEVPWFLAQFGPRLRSEPRRRWFDGSFLRPDGERVRIEGYTTAVRDGDGSVAFLVRRISAPSPSGGGGDRQSEDRRPELDAWLDRMFRSGIVGIIAGQGDQILEANDAFLAMIGYTREELESGGVDWTELTPREWLDVDARAGEVMLREGVSPPIEKEYLRKDGTRARVRIAGAVVSEQPFRWISVVEDRTAEREYMDAIRRAVVPPELPQPDGLVVDARYFPSDGFTGDFYDLFPLLGGAGWGLVLGDVAGHGYEAAGMTALARHALRGAALADPAPVRALDLLNRAIRDAGLAPSFCTAVFAQLRVDDGVVHARIARAGHPYPLVVRRDGRVEEIAPGGVPLGVLPAPDLDEELVVLEPGDTMVLYTDGLTDTRPGEPAYPVETLERIAGAAAGTSPRALADAILDHAHDRLSRPLSDDIAVITLGLAG
jgi:PAS domain S-box-containing protein